jgi:hypothetical protein
MARRAAFLASAATAAAGALAAPDLDLAHERAAVAAALTVEAPGDLGRVRPDAEHRQSLCKLLAVSAQRPLP